MTCCRSFRCSPKAWITKNSGHIITRVTTLTHSGVNTVLLHLRKHTDTQKLSRVLGANTDTPRPEVGRYVHSLFKSILQERATRVRLAELD